MVWCRESNIHSLNFKLNHSTYYNDYDFTSNSKEVDSEVNGFEEEILKNIFVKIEDCPEWSHEELQRIRNNQLLKTQLLPRQKKR